ncbi:beta-lactamase-like protein [Gilbertella persicaria]|uniref:beta-lactamase-like protein n=1 Tax=Gilbertella persicaria TaxID=101096 RepID=UPI00221FD8EB|nr:beta-lactamase-like protein [Gilbertella persicaria]KAI8063371.1 beta-lactamase-like protein [Gilbertella persicaria]
MEELVIYHGQTATQTEPSSSTHFSQLGDMFQQAIPEGWRSIYTSKDIVSCIEKIQPVRYTETLSLFSTLNVIPYSSGYSLGSANWLLETSFKRIAFLSTSSVYTHLHPAPFDDDILKDTDVVVVAGLTQPSEKDASFERAKSRLLVQLARTIQSLHNVVLVCPASGILFDLIGDIEAYFRSLGKEIGPERHQTPIYVVNPMADQSLKYANICGEWMNSGRHDLLYLPQMPLTHGELMNTGAVQSITSLEAALLSKKTIREPCIVFTGDSACITKGFLSWFLEHWGASELNTCIFIDPDTPHPIQQHIPPQCKMNCIRLPLDTRLKLEDVPSILHTHWQTHASAKHLLLPKMKGSGLIKEQVSDTQVSIYEPGQVIRIDLQRDWERISVSEKLAKSIEPNMMPATVNGISTVWAPIHGTLNYYNNRLEIQPSTSITKDINGITTIHLPKDMDAKVIMNGSSTTVVTNNDQVRALLRKMTVIE